MFYIDKSNMFIYKKVRENSNRPMDYFVYVAM